MKTITNRQFTVKLQSEDESGITTAQLIKITLSQPPQGGFTFTDMRIRNRIADLVEKSDSGSEINFEDSDYSAARKCIEDFRWPVSHPDIASFGEQFGL